MVYLVAGLVSLALLLILFFALKSTVKRIDYNTKKYFVDKLQDYDYLIDEKKQILNDLDKRIKDNEDKLSVGNDNNVNTASINNNFVVEHVVPKYTDEDLFKKYKEIKRRFDFDYDAILKDFVHNKLSYDNKDYNVLASIRQKVNQNVIFDALNLKKSEQKQHIYSVLTSNEKAILNKYIDLDRIKITHLITQLDLCLEKADPAVYVFTSEKDRNYKYISSYIKMVYDDNVNEGIRIKYKGILYDYSL